jgi:hypothetical protein
MFGMNGIKSFAAALLLATAVTSLNAAETTDRAPATEKQRALGTWASAPRYVDSAPGEAETDLASIYTLALLAGGLIGLGIAVRRRQGK